MFTKVLVANRGEIAVRVMRTLKEMGIPSVAVASQPDAHAAHARLADECKIIGGAAAAESYLNMDTVLDAAVDTGAQAIHPGYGFLSENAAFAEACAQRDITFIGPSAQAMRVMGSKTASRQAMQAAGVPVVPGFQDVGADMTTLHQAAEKLGYPVLIKASAGGGGKGMRAVDAAGDLESSLTLCANEAQAAFGDGTVYLEKLLVRPRHIEIQVFGDHVGNTFFVGERECSVQRRHQKILEECPSPGVDEDLRSRMGQAAVAAAQAVDYRGAGTVEFLLDARGEFYFLEMNTRLQVEHPVTEMVYGVDLVRAQVLTAAGEPLDFDPAALERRGHAIEARLYAEDPAQGFLPQAGPVLELEIPQLPGVRFDSGLTRGQPVEVHYDPLLAKIVAWAPDREQATTRLRRALAETVILGLTTNLDFLADVLDLEAWRRGDLSTSFLDDHVPTWTAHSHVPDAVWVLAAAALAGGSATGQGSGGTRTLPSPWTALNGWRPLEDK